MDSRSKFVRIWISAEHHSIAAQSVVDSARQNACDTEGVQPESEEFYAIAIASISESIRARDLEQELRSWIKKNDIKM